MPLQRVVTIADEYMKYFRCLVSDIQMICSYFVQTIKREGN